MVNNPNRASFTYIDKERVAFVHKTQTNGPRGGKHKVWEARADGNYLCQRSTKIAATRELEEFLKTGIRPTYDTV